MPPCKITAASAGGRVGYQFDRLPIGEPANMHNSPGLIQHLCGGRTAWLFQESIYWTCFGLLGNLLFGSRFVVQWLHSERHQRLIVPPVFWYLNEISESMIRNLRHGIVN